MLHKPQSSHHGLNILCYSTSTHGLAEEWDPTPKKKATKITHCMFRTKSPGNSEPKKHEDIALCSQGNRLPPGFLLRSESEATSVQTGLFVVKYM